MSTSASDAPAATSWRGDLRLGFAPMDEVHADFLEAVDTLVRAARGDVAAALAEVERCTREHFEMEERWMSETAFPARICHEDEHAAVLASVVGVGERVAQGEVEVAWSLGKALLEWFPAHADYMDSALAQWMCKLRYGGKPVVLRRLPGAGSI